MEEPKKENEITYEVKESFTEGYNTTNNDVECIDASNLRPTKHLSQALKEGEDILSGKVKTKGYHNIDELFEDILNEN